MTWSRQTSPRVRIPAVRHEEEKDYTSKGEAHLQEEKEFEVLEGEGDQAEQRKGLNRVGLTRRRVEVTGIVEAR